MDLLNIGLKSKQTDQEKVRCCITCIEVLKLLGWKKLQPYANEFFFYNKIVKSNLKGVKKYISGTAAFEDDHL